MHRIIALWCHPRSMSTAVERIMRERGDLKCLHEPFMYPYYLNQQNRDMPYFKPSPEQPVTYADVRNMINRQAQRTPVFFKDMSYYMTSELASDWDFSKKLTHCFLIRSPRAAIASYYRLDKDVTLKEIGVEAQWVHFTRLVELGLKPVILQAEVIRSDPQGTVAAWWNAIGLNFVSEAFNWNKEYPDDWNSVQEWHRSAIASSSIQSRSAVDDEAEQNRFAEAVREAPHLVSYLEHHRPFYERLKRQCA